MIVEDKNDDNRQVLIIDDMYSGTRNPRIYYDCAPTLTLRAMGGGAKVVIIEDDKDDVGEVKKILNIYPSGGQAGNIYDPEGIAPCLPGFGAGGGGKELKIIEDNKKKR